MMRVKNAGPLLIAIGIGAIYFQVARRFWGFYVVNSPVNELLVSKLARQGFELSYVLAISMHDFIVNVALALPFAALISFIRPARMRTYTLLALLTAVGFSFWGTNFSGLGSIWGEWTFWLNEAVFLVSLPLASLLMWQIRKRQHVT
ncbi:MAG: hypothetical protein HKM98_11180 [Gammaproteobacteria bacterium]|nr:hypothetical protein [Gammaproteobacteria bacterium]